MLHHVKIRVRVRATTVTTPRGVPFRGTLGAPGHVRNQVPHQVTLKVTHLAGRHGRLKPGSRGPRD
ncbi:hypothetical protein ETD83_41735 [Actinomadura soli]|uniref:Uncharacterized protein n=1 Tax=Actinomadura soli TaxID=2508997 RepID=A0A5C4IY38_9ACTN|nr:hypothetical protein ETD83_41735 [Actinomadura soli]